MKICGYTVPPVVVSFLLTSCAKTIEPPCLDLLLNRNQLQISASNLETICKETTYQKNPDETIQTTTKKYDHTSTKALIDNLTIVINQKFQKRMDIRSYEIRTDLALSLEQGFHEIEVIVCNEDNTCSLRELPVFSYGTELVIATTIANDLLPPKINGELYPGKRITCRKCQASDYNGIASLTFEQEKILGDYTFIGLQPSINYYGLIRNLQINERQPITITAFDHRGNKTKLEISFDGYASSALGGL